MKLLESIRVELSDSRHIKCDLEPHLKRLSSSAKELNFSLGSLNQIKEKINSFLNKEFNENTKFKNHLQGLFKLRLTLDADSKLCLELEPYLRDLDKDWNLKILKADEYHSNSEDYRNRYKLIPRIDLSMYFENYDEVIWLNENAHICEGSFTNIFWFDDEAWHTPSLETGILAGTAREAFINKLKAQNITIREGFYKVEALKKAKKVVLTNALIIEKSITNINYENMIS